MSGKKNQKPDLPKLILMTPQWKQRVSTRKGQMDSEMNRMIMEGALAAGVPDGYRFNQKTLNFDPPPRKGKNDAAIPDVSDQ